MRWMEIAWADLGVTETAGERATPAIVAYFRDAEGPAVTSDEVPWCAAFAGACLSRAGISIADIPRGDRYLARAYLRIGTELPLDRPRVGAIAVLTRTGDPANGHVGFVTRWTADTITLLGGNQADSVNETTFQRSRLIGLRWPETVTPRDLDAAGSRISAAAARQRADGTKGGALVTGGQLPPAPQPGQRVGWLQGWVDGATAWKGVLSTIEQLLVFLWSKWPLIAAVVAAYFLARMAWSAGWIRAWRAEDASSGVHVGRATATQEPREPEARV